MVLEPIKVAIGVNHSSSMTCSGKSLKGSYGCLDKSTELNGVRDVIPAGTEEANHPEPPTSREVASVPAGPKP